MLAMSVPGVLLLVVIAILTVVFIAWLLPRADTSLTVRHVGPDQPAERRRG